MAEEDEGVFDYHVHTTQSSDCETPMMASCEAAVAAGVTEIAFTDHIEHEPADPSFGYWNGRAYRDDLGRARERFGDHLTILAGAEVDFNVRIASQVEAFLGRHEFDFVIGSVHYGDDGEIIFPEYFSTRDLDAVMVPYYEQLQAAAETGWFDTLGHLDLPKRYAPVTVGHYDPLRYTDQLTCIFKALIARSGSFEINTSGLRQPPRTSMPGPQLVSLYVSLGGSLVTIGSDSHVASTVGAGVERTLDMLQLCGIDTVSSFRDRARTQVPIDSLLHA